MGMLRFDHVGVIVEDLDAAEDFFLALGFESDGRMFVDGEVVDRINGLEGVRAELVMVRTPDRTGCLELIRYHSPRSGEGVEHHPADRLGYRHIAIEVDDVHGTVERLGEKGFGLVGDVQDYGTSWRLVYVRGPEGLIVELAERLGASTREG
jgi:catechol 2,3-dioxygenase-like lactoylglutathione lyase family enzyme